jgi:hypothetical protein
MEKQENQPIQPPVQLEPLKTLLTWTSPARPFKKRDKEFFRTIASLLILVVIILFFAQQFMLILAVLATAFLAYVLNTVPPEMVEHQITTQGVVTAGHSYEWKNLKHFFFSKKHNSDILNVATKQNFPSLLMLLIEEKDKDQIKEMLTKYLLYKENITPNWLDQASAWLAEKIPLEKK